MKTTTVAADQMNLTAVPKWLKKTYGVSRHYQTVHAWTSRGIGSVKLNYIKIGRSRFVTVDDLQEFFAKVAKC